MSLHIIYMLNINIPRYRVNYILDSFEEYRLRVHFDLV